MFATVISMMTKSDMAFKGFSLNRHLKKVLSRVSREDRRHTRGRHEKAKHHVY